MMSTATPAAYRKRPVTIHAAQWTSGLTTSEANAILSWLADNGCHPLVGDALALATRVGDLCGWWINPGDGGLVLRTLEGDMRVSPGDWIICGVQGEVYPCKPDIFAATYDAATYAVDER